MLSKTEWTQYGVCICFSAALAAIFGLGVSYLVAASENKHDSEVSDVEKIIDAWEEYRPVFQGLRVSIKLSDSHLMPPNDIVDFVFDDNDLDYNHLKYYTNATSFPQNYTFYVTRSREDHNEYNVTASILLEVAVLEDGTSLQYEDDVIVLKRVKNNANSKMCRINDLGYWNGTVSACYMTYRLTALCYVLNSTYQIEDGGCLDGDRTKVETLKWTSENTPKNTLPISSTVRSSYDPYVEAYKEDLLDLTQTSTQLSVIGLVFVIVSVFLALLPGAFCYAKCRRKPHPLMEMEMHGNVSMDRV